MSFLSILQARATRYRGSGWIGFRYHVSSVKAGGVWDDTMVESYLGERLGVIFDSEVQLKKNTVTEAFINALFYYFHSGHM